ncbi:hypothetical protein [Nonomuraea sp. MG754425]|uniref:hypothetical protein n=1 Tax=Nonomuraea sp. MG754425 TaxID=2570319 RepID=UPI001F2E59C9|nr:hypothetical protein [Nonomuraea sp. MG754425]
MPTPRIASPTDETTPTPTGSVFLSGPSLPSATTTRANDTDNWFAPVAWLAVILTGIAATCYVVWRRRHREAQFVDGSAND